MHIPSLSVLAALTALALAASPNPFNVPQGFSLTAGQPTTLKWRPTTPGTVMLRLRQGASNDLEAGTVIEGIPSFIFTTAPFSDHLQTKFFAGLTFCSKHPQQWQLYLHPQQT